MSPTILKQTILSSNPPDIFSMVILQRAQRIFSEISTEQMKSCVISLQSSKLEILVHPRDAGEYVEGGNLQDSLEDAAETVVNESDSTKNANIRSCSQKSVVITMKIPTLF